MGTINTQSATGRAAGAPLLAPATPPIDQAWRRDDTPFAQLAEAIDVRTLAAGALAGLGAGSLLGRGRPVFAIAGGVLGAIIGAAAGQLPIFRAAVVARHATQPWLQQALLDSVDTAFRLTAAQYGDQYGAEIDGINDGQDAFRHAAWAATMVVSLMRDHGLDNRQAVAIAEQAGTAHENDRTWDPRSLQRAMDLHNNAVGRSLAGDGRAADGAWLTDDAVADRVRTAMRDGSLVVQASPGRLRASGPADLDRS